MARMGGVLSIGVMDSFSLVLHGNPIPVQALPRRKVRSVLKLLALESAHALSRDALIEHLWADLDPTAAAAQLYNALYGLRKVLGEDAPKLVSGVVRLEPSGGLEVDALTFRELAHAGLAAKDAALLARAAGFVNGVPLTEDLYEEWATPYRETLQDLQVRVLEALAEADLAQAERAWTQLLTLEPTSEAAHAGLMRHFAGQGQVARMLEQFERYREALREELNAEPSEGMTALLAELSNPGSGVPVAGPPALKHNLPAPTVPLVGREAELAELINFFRDPDWRLLTVLGPGGNGKTRLALEAAWANHALFADGAFWVALENLSADDTPTQTVLQALGLSLPGTQAEAGLFEYLRDKRCLLVLDNLEHLPTIGEWVARLMAAAPQVNVLATSRSLLHLQGERVLELAGLTGEAMIELFVQGARRVNPSFTPTQTDLERIKRLGEHLAGSPLAIELAASWLRLMDLEEIASEVALDLDFLERPVRDRHARHHSVRAVFESSWRLLQAPEQQTLASLAVFVGGFTLASARAVSGASRAAIVALTDRSLVRLMDGRLELHPLVRQYVLEQAARDPEHLRDLREAHAKHYLEQLRSLPARFRTPDLEPYLETKRLVESMFSNARAAWQHTLESRQLEALNDALEGFFVLHQLGNRLLELPGLLPDHLDLPAALRSRFALQRGIAKTALGQLKESEAELMQASPEHLTNTERLYRLRQLSITLSRTARTQEALGFATDAVREADAGHDVFEQSLSQMQLGDVLAILGRLEEAEQAMQAAQHGANVRTRSFLAIHAATLAGRKGELERAEHELREAATLLRQLDDVRNLQVVQNNLATALQLQGKYTESLEVLESSAKVARHLGDQRILAVILNSRIITLRALGRYDEALEVGRENLALCQQTGNTLRYAHCLLRLGHVHYERGAYETALEQYRLALAEQVNEAIEEAQIGVVRTRLRVGEVKPAQLQLAAMNPSGARPLAVWRAVFAVLIAKHNVDVPAMKSALQHVFTAAHDASPLNASECLAEVLGPLRELQPELALQLARSLMEDARSSHHARKLAATLLNGELANIRIPTWPELISGVVL